MAQLFIILGGTSPALTYGDWANIVQGVEWFVVQDMPYVMEFDVYEDGVRMATGWFRGVDRRLEIGVS